MSENLPDDKPGTPPDVVAGSPAPEQPSSPVAEQPSSPAPAQPSSPVTPHEDRVGALEKTVSTLADIVAGLIPKDDKPVKRPWTHYGSKNNG